MNLNDVYGALSKIEASKADWEAAHCFEDALYHDFIEHVAESGPPDLASMARVVLSSKRIEFARVTS